MEFWIIEHPVRGVLCDYDEVERKPHFKWSISRTDERARRFYTRGSAVDWLHKRRDRLPKGCEIYHYKRQRLVS